MIPTACQLSASSHFVSYSPTNLTTITCRGWKHRRVREVSAARGHKIATLNADIYLIEPNRPRSPLKFVAFFFATVERLEK